MSMVYEVDPTSGVIVTTARGVVTAEELEAHMRGLARNPELPRPLRELWDGRAVERFAVWGADIQRIVGGAGTADGGLGGARLAIVASQDVIYGMARMAEILSESTAVTIRAFRELEPAQRWIQA